MAYDDSKFAIAAKSSLVRRFPVGAELGVNGQLSARVWAPRPKSLQLALARTGDEAAGVEFFKMSPEADGYYSITVAGVHAGATYGFRLDDEQLLPDPASRFQPTGPTGLSEVIDPRRFSWTDGLWKGVTDRRPVIYEIHVGTFTREGTWGAATRELAELAAAGMTILEVMPIADFPGSFGWGYDGVNLFAPTRLYGRPDDVRAFIDKAHEVGMGVILDVVYNHFGNVENHLPTFAAAYNTDRYDNEWGGAINFDGPDAGPVREFFEANVRYWIEEFHFDGFRFDATQAIHDKSDNHILGVLTNVARQAAGGRQIYCIAENEPQDVRTIRPADTGGHGMDAVWNDDFHHAAMVRLTGKNPAYYSDYLGLAEEFVAAIKYGFLYQGQRSHWQSKPRGTPTYGLPPSAFVTFLQNHDQVANSADGSRIHHLASPGCWRAMTALWLLGPQTPLFFQGQEFAASSPFLYFADYTGEMAKCVTEGRAKFLSQFPHLATPESQRQLPKPCDPDVFARSKLILDERKTHHTAYDLHRDLLQLRKTDATLSRADSARVDAVALNSDCLLVRFFGDNQDDRLLFVNFGREFIIAPAPQPLLAPPAQRGWELRWSSENQRYGGFGTPAIEFKQGWRIPGESAVVLAMTEQHSEPDDMKGSP